MTADEIIDRIERSARAGGMDPVTATVGGRSGLVGRSAEFKWLALTKLHTFLIATTFPAEEAQPHALDNFMDEAARYAKANKGGLPVGLQTGLAVITVAVVEEPSPPAVEWASKVHGRKFAVIPFPVLVDATAGVVTRPERMVIGGMFAGSLKTITDRHVTQAVSATR